VATLAAKGGDMSKLTKLEIVAILLICYNMMHEKDNTHKKEYLVNMLQGCIQRQPGNLGVRIENGLNEAMTPTAQSADKESDAKHEGVHPGHTHDHSFNEEKLFLLFLCVFD
jgi:hypothetical protein